jgi:hypothetical protein
MDQTRASLTLWRSGACESSQQAAAAKAFVHAEKSLSDVYFILRVSEWRDSHHGLAKLLRSPTPTFCNPFSRQGQLDCVALRCCHSKHRLYDAAKSTFATIATNLEIGF